MFVHVRDDLMDRMRGYLPSLNRCDTEANLVDLVKYLKTTCTTADIVKEAVNLLEH